MAERPALGPPASLPRVWSGWGSSTSDAPALGQRRATVSSGSRQNATADSRPHLPGVPARGRPTRFPARARCLALRCRLLAACPRGGETETERQRERCPFPPTRCHPPEGSGPHPMTYSFGLHHHLGARASTRGSQGTQFSPQQGASLSSESPDMGPCPRRPPVAGARPCAPARSGSLCLPGWAPCRLECLEPAPREPLGAPIRARRRARSPHRRAQPTPPEPRQRPRRECRVDEWTPASRPHRPVLPPLPTG